MSKISLVTGGSGYVASHLVQQLLEDGNTVHATVRSVNDQKKISHLLSMQENWPGKLTLFEADLLTEGSFDAAMQDCSVVYHVASPFLLEEQIKNSQKEVIEPALKGTQNVLGSVEKNATVKLVIMTSTVGAIFGDYADVRSMENNTLSEKYFNTSSTPTHNAYHFSKVLAEKEAWRLWETSGNMKRWKLVTINPGLILGPSLSPNSNSGSLFLIEELLRKELWFGVPNLWFTTVDVRDVARAHINAAKNPDSSGRYILAEKEMTSFKSFSLILRPLCNNPWWLPKHTIPDIVTRVVGPLFGLTQKWMSLNLGVKFSIENRRSIEELKIDYRPLEETLADYYKTRTVRN